MGGAVKYNVSRLGVTAIACVASGCATPRVYNVVTPHDSKVTIRRAPDRTVVLEVGDKARVPLPGLKDARIGVVWSAQKSDFLVLHGATDDCPDAAVIATITGGSVSVQRIGECQDRLAFTENGDRLLIRQVPAQGNSTVTVYRDGDTGVLTVRTETPPPHRVSAARRGATAEDRPAPDGPATEESTTAVLDDEPAAPVPVPPVSSRVGDNVLPAPVGAGPLPAGAGQPAPPFATPPKTDAGSDTIPLATTPRTDGGSGTIQ